MLKNINLNELKNIPNLLTVSRFIILPIAILQAYLGNKILFSILWITMILTDLADGYFARKLKLASDLGNFLDSMADELVCYSALPCIFFLAKQKVLEHPLLFLSPLVMLLFSRVITLRKFGIEFKMHLLSGKLANLSLYPAILAVIYIEQYYYVLFAFVIIVFINQFEEMLIVLKYPHPDKYMKSFYFKSLNKKPR